MYYYLRTYARTQAAIHDVSYRISKAVAHHMLIFTYPSMKKLIILLTD